MKRMSKKAVCCCLLGIAVVAFAIFYRSGSSRSGVEAPHSLPVSTPSQTGNQEGVYVNKAASDLLAKAESAEDVKLAVANLRPFQIYTLGNGNAFKSAVETWYEKSPEFALNLIASLPREARKSAFLWGEKYYLQKPLLFIASANASLSPSEARGINLGVFVKLGEHDPKRAIELIEQQGQGDAKTVGISGAYAAWSKKDIKAALLGVNSLSFPEDRDTAYGAILENAKNQDIEFTEFTEFIEFIEFIHKVEMPEEIRSRMAQAISEKHPEKHDE